MAYNFLKSNRDQMYLMPVSIRDWLPEGHLAWFIIDVVKEFDLTPFYGKHRVVMAGDVQHTNQV